MAHPLRDLFYDDAPDFGGHELQTLSAVRHIASQPNTEVGFIFFRGNTRWSRQLADLTTQCPSLESMPQDYASLRFQVFRTLLLVRAIRRTAATMATFAPDIVVVAQGAIAICSAGLLAAKWAGLPTISYIPMTHPERMFSASRLRAALRERVNRFYYLLPDEYITIGQRLEDYLRRNGLRQRVTIVPVAVELAHHQVVDRGTARVSLGLAPGDRIVALIGRVQFWRKQQDLAVMALAIARQQVPELKLLVVGDGPDLGALKDLARAEKAEDAVVFAGWTDRLSTVFSAIDALLIPSRYEGVPLVMLEAMYFRRPVIASAVDGMVDVLPQHWLFLSGDVSAFAARLVEGARANESALLEANHDTVVSTYSLPVLKRTFMAAILSVMDRVGRGRTRAK